MSRILLPLVILFTIGLGITLFLASDSPSDGTEQQDVEATTPAAEEAPDAAPELTPVANASGADQTVERTTLKIPDTKPQAKYAQAAPEGEGYLVSVVDGNTEEPLPLAEVMVLDTGVADMQKVEVAMRMKPDFENLFVHFGVTYRTDAKGQVRIPEAIDDIIIAGRTDEHFNFDFDVDTDQNEILLRLNPVELLGIKVVDQSGNLVEGAPIALRMRDERFTQELTRSFTGKEGIAYLKIFDLLKMQLGQVDTFAGLQVLTQTPIEVKVQLQELPKEPPVLVLPPTGQVEVLVLDELDKPTKEDFFVRLDLIQAEEMGGRAAVVEDWQNQHENLVNTTQDGVASFPLVDFDQFLRATAYSADRERTAMVEGEGPIRGGDKIVLRLKPVVQQPVLVGRILNEEGAVGKNLSLGTQLEVKSPHGSSSSGGQIRTDDEGIFRLVLDDEYEAGNEVTLTITMRKTKRKPKRTVRVELKDTLPPGDHDLGDLVVTVPPMLAQGIILDATGAPLKGAEVMLQREQRYGEGPEDVYWNNLWEIRTESAKDGSFLIRGDAVSGRYRVQASHAKHKDSSQEIDLGAEDVTIHMLAGLIVKGRFLFDEEIQPRDLHITLEREQQDELHHWGSNHSLDRDGGFQLDSQDPGSVRLVLNSEYPGGAVYGTDLLLQPTENGILDLGDIDLRGRLRHAKLSVVDGLGKPIEQFGLQTPDRPWASTAVEQPVVLVLGPDTQTVTVSADGYRSVILDHPDMDQEVVLLDGFTARVFIDNFSILPSDHYLHVMLLGMEDGSGTGANMHNYHVLDLVSQGVLEGVISNPGPFQVQITLKQMVEVDPDNYDTSPGGVLMASSPAPSIPLGNPKDYPVLHIEDVLGMQEFHISLDPEVLEAAVLRLQGKQQED